MGERRGTRGLELWCRKMTEGYPGVKIENMTTSWRDGLGFCAIIHHFRPDLIDFSKLNKDDIYHNNELAFTVAEKHLGIPALLEPEDMVEFPVPDRLSILTYLSQFYQTFVVSQGSPSRIVPKRPTPPSERGIVSPASTSPPTKVSVRSAGSVRREPCAKCNQPVFIAERLNVGRQLFHRTCFRCARCDSQLTLANYYETENSEYCCETCPDEEQAQDDQKHILTRSLSDEEKSASLKKSEAQDDYSAMFETALEKIADTTDSDRVSEFDEARSHFIKSQLVNSDTESEEESPPGKPPEVSDQAMCSSSDAILSSSDAIKSGDIKPDLIRDERTGDSPPDLIDKCGSDSGLPSDKQSNVNNVSDSNQLEAASNELEVTDSFVTKDDPDSSLVKARARLFENISSPKILVDDSKIDSAENVSVESHITILDSSEEAADNVSAAESHISILDSSEEAKREDIPITMEEVKKEEQDYPDELNPFGDDEGPPEKPSNSQDYDPSLNPFGSDDEEQPPEKPSPKPRTRKKINALPTDNTMNTTLAETWTVTTGRISFNPFEEEDVEEQASTKKFINAPRISLNPFWSDGEEHEEGKPRRRPVPLPRNSKSNDSPDLKLRQSMNSLNSGSSTSLTNVSTSKRKKAPAPKPPGESPFSSLTSSPSHSVQHSPGSTVRLRKTKRAPLPPSSTPFNTHRLSDINISPVNKQHADESVEQLKTTKDETNRNRQSQLSLPSRNSTGSYESSIPNKSTYGKWKKRKGPAPSRPVPQRRTIKSLPMEEIRRELDLIEVQQQGLERQGVRLEQIIREKFESGSVDTDTSSAAEVEDMILQLFELVNEKNELFRKQAELMYLRRQQRLEEEHADVEYQIRCLMLQPEANKTDSDKAREEELLSRLIDIVERRSEIVDCLEMDRIREAEEDDSINTHLNAYTLRRDEIKPPSSAEKVSKKDKKKHKKEKKFKLKGHKIDMDKDVDESEIPPSKDKEKKKKKFNIF